jgi:hypothetical protein
MDAPICEHNQNWNDCIKCRPNLATLSKKECKHTHIENNMVPDTCRDCGKVLNKEEWEEKNKYPLNTFHGESRREIIAFIRKMHQEAIEQTIRKMISVVEHDSFTGNPLKAALYVFFQSFAKNEGISLSEHVHESDGLLYTSNPPKSKCKLCGEFY